MRHCEQPSNNSLCARGLAGVADMLVHGRNFTIYFSNETVGASRHRTTLVSVVAFWRIEEEGDNKSWSSTDGNGKDRAVVSRNRGQGEGHFTESAMPRF